MPDVTIVRRHECRTCGHAVRLLTHQEGPTTCPKCHGREFLEFEPGPDPDEILALVSRALGDVPLSSPHIASRTGLAVALVNGALIDLCEQGLARLVSGARGGAIGYVKKGAR